MSPAPSNAPAPADTLREIIADALVREDPIPISLMERYEVEALADAALAAIAAHGLALVPVEPSEAMLQACETEWRQRIQDKASRGAFGEGGIRAPFLANWKAMLAAAPLSPPVGAWRPIKTAPRNGQHIMIYDPSVGQREGQRNEADTEWTDSECEVLPFASHWHELLPPPPIDVKAEGET